MKAYKVAIFIFSIIACLAAIAALFPEEGITAGEITLNFPSLSEFTSEEQVPEQPELTPEELLAIRAMQMRQEQEEGFINFFRENEAAIHFPADDSAYHYLDPLFEALDGADSTLVRIVHYGDSQIEEDRISNMLRRRLQEQFGGQGVGIVPLYQSVQSQTIGQSCSYEPTRYSVFWLSSFRRKGSRRYGPMGQLAVINSNINLSIVPRTKVTGFYSAHYFNTLTLITAPQNTITAGLKGKRQTINSDGSNLQFTEFQLQDSTTTVNLSLAGAGDVYGVMMTGKTGVNIDNMPMRGCSGTIFSGIDSQQLKAYFAYTNTRLIIMQFGGNSMPYLKTQKAIDNYAATIGEQVRYMQRQAPNAQILFIGPSDMTTRIQGKMQTYTWLEDVDNALMKEVTDAGAAYWSLFKAMGGKGAMAQWVRSGLAGSDYIHFTRKGATEVGNMLSNALMTGYDYYKWRQREFAPIPKAQPQVNTLSIDSNSYTK
ncbi:MAG: hypothetical protein IJ776_07190 [Paludibacteraceae bacterium]|nr:hypothetical protein [Paludibacteraceae bacterium]